MQSTPSLRSISMPPHGRGGAAAGPADAGAPPVGVGYSDHSRFVARLRRQGAGALLLRSRALRVRAAAGVAARRASPCDVIAPALIPRRPATGSRRIDAMRPSWPCCIVRARSRPFTFRRSRRKRPAISCAVAKTSARTSCGRGIASPNSCSGTAAASRRRRGRGRSATTRGCVRRPGRSPHSSRRIARICRAVDEVVARLRAVEEDLRALLTLAPLRPRVAAPALLPRDR